MFAKTASAPCGLENIGKPHLCGFVEFKSSAKQKLQKLRVRASVDPTSVYTTSLCANVTCVPVPPRSCAICRAGSSCSRLLRITGSYIN